MTRHNFIYEGEDCRLDKAVAEFFDLTVTRSAAQKLIKEGNVTVGNNTVSKPSYKLAGGEEVTVNLPEPITVGAEPEDIPIEIVYQDADILVVNKPQGLTVHPSETQPNHTLVNALMFRIRDLSGINGVLRPGIVHRIDKNTSGLLVVAKNDAAHLSLSRQIAEKIALRRYIALVDRNIKEDGGTVNAPLSRDKNNRLRMAVTAGGRYAVTHYKVTERFGDYTLLKLQLETGRTHQIRAHMKHISHPVTGDELYGGSNKFKLNGQLLHAYELTLTHPVSGELMTFTAPLPDYFEAVLAKLRRKEMK